MGTIPKAVQVNGNGTVVYTGNVLAAGCIIRKTTSEGTLKVEIIRGKDVVSTSETAAPFGVIEGLHQIKNMKLIISRGREHGVHVCVSGVRARFFE
jgi:hypothetical protein